MDVDVEGAVLCSGYLISKHISRGRCSLGGDLHSTGVWAGLGMETGDRSRDTEPWRMEGTPSPLAMAVGTRSCFRGDSRRRHNSPKVGK